MLFFSLIFICDNLFLTGHWPLLERRDFSSTLLVSVTGALKLN